MKELPVNLNKNFRSEKSKKAGGDGIARGKELKRVFFAFNCNEEISMKKTFLTCMAVVAVLAIASRRRHHVHH